MKATTIGGALVPLDKCIILIPSHSSSGGPQSCCTITLTVLPEISDSKSAMYNDVAVIGRSLPIKTFSHSENRVIGMKLHFPVLTKEDVSKNLKNVRALQSAVYPIDQDTNNPYLPPPICKIKCGDLLTSNNNGFLCVVLKQYSVNYRTDVVWDETTYLPYLVEMDLTWEMVTNNAELPGQSMIFNDTPDGGCPGGACG